VNKIRYYSNRQGRELFKEWLDDLSDKTTKARVAARLIRLQNGNFGDCKPLSDGVWELRIDWGPGYRVYYAIEDKKVILLCHGGDKRKQTKDIAEAIKRWQDWKTR
jgi:putative addiction module killer protein